MNNSKIYLICEEVDLGYHVKHAFLDKEIANTKCNDLNKIYINDTISCLMKHCNYSLDAATSYARPMYFVEEHDIK